MSSKRTKLQEDAFFAFCKKILKCQSVNWRQLGGAHHVLNALIDKGPVKLGNFTAAEDIRRYAYVLTPRGIARKTALTRAFLVRKMEEYEVLKEEIEELKKESERFDASGVQKWPTH